MITKTIVIIGIVLCLVDAIDIPKSFVPMEMQRSGATNAKDHLKAIMKIVTQRNETFLTQRVRTPQITKEMKKDGVNSQQMSWDRNAYEYVDSGYLISRQRRDLNVGAGDWINCKTGHSKQCFII